MRIPFSDNFITNLRTIAWVTVVWTIIGVFIFAYDYLILHAPYVIIDGFDFRDYFKAQVLACLVSGLTGGTAAVLFFYKWLRTIPYGRALLYIFLIYSVFSLSIGYFAGSVYFSSALGKSFFSEEVRSRAFEFLLGMELSRLFFVWLFVMLGTLIVLLINDKYGPGVFLDMLLGKYFQPRREERIFMFLDLRGSTTIAERLGEEKYFDFIREVFTDATPAILHSKGEIYQYIGDEILISWKMKKGLYLARCIKCFFEIKNAFQVKSDYYNKTFGVVPDFKAGVHGGAVMAGEVGVVKRDIAFSGDVLNTAARIQGECNRLKADLLISGFMNKEMDWSENIYQTQMVDELLLRGKQEKIKLFAVNV